MLAQDEFVKPIFDLDHRLDESLKHIKDFDEQSLHEGLIDLQELVFKVCIASKRVRDEKELRDNPPKPQIIDEEGEIE